MILKKKTPIIVSTLICTILFSLSEGFNFKLNYQKFLELSITVFTVISGLLFAVYTLLFSIKNTQIDLNEVSEYIRTPIIFGFITIFISILFLLIEDFFGRHLTIGVYVIVYLNIFCFIFCISVFDSIIKILPKMNK